MPICTPGVYGVLIGILLLFNLVVVITTCTGKVKRSSDAFVSARNSFGPFKLGTSLFASALGSWIIFLVPELSYLFGVWPIFLYTIAVILPMFFLRFVARSIRKASGDDATSLGDFVIMRYGIPMHIIFLGVSALALFLSIAGELMFVGSAMNFINSKVSRTRVILIVAALTWTYTAIGGLSASIISDFYQSVIVITVLTVGMITAGTKLNISLPELTDAATFSTEGLISGAIMVVSFFPGYLIDQTAWQRIWAGRDLKSIKLGVLIAISFVAPVLLLFGFSGILSFAVLGANERSFSSVFFSLITPLHFMLVGCILVLTIALVASSLDSALNAISAIFWPTCKKYPFPTLWIILINGIAMVLATLAALFWQRNVLILFLIGNLLAAAILPPILYGLTEHSTQLGAIFGFVLGMLSIGVFGFIRTASFSGALSAYTISFGLASIDTFLTFVIAMVVSFLSTVIVSFVHEAARPSTRRTFLQHHSSSVAVTV